MNLYLISIVRICDECLLSLVPINIEGTLTLLYLSLEAMHSFHLSFSLCFYIFSSVSFLSSTCQNIFSTVSFLSSTCQNYFSQEPSFFFFFLFSAFFLFNYICVCVYLLLFIYLLFFSWVGL